MTSVRAELAKNNSAEYYQKFTGGQPSMPLIHYAASEDDYEAIVILIVKYKVDVNARADNGRTALSYASQHGFDLVVKLLLHHGADPNIMDNIKDTALLWAIYNQHWRVVTRLLRAGANPYHCYTDGRDAFMWSVVGIFDCWSLEYLMDNYPFDHLNNMRDNENKKIRELRASFSNATELLNRRELDYKVSIGALLKRHCRHPLYEKWLYQQVFEFLPLVQVSQDIDRSPL